MWNLALCAHCVFRIETIANFSSNPIILILTVYKMTLRLPLGALVLDKLCVSLNLNRKNFYKVSILLTTFLTYWAYHMARRPLSVVKSALHHTDCSKAGTPPAGINSSDSFHWCDWKPFENSDAKQLLAYLDSGFLFSYAIVMFFAGYVAERCNLRYF